MSAPRLKKILKCPKCGAKKFSFGESTLTLKRGSFKIQIKGVPTQICSTCKEEFIPGVVAEPLSSLAERAYLEIIQAKKVLQTV